MAGKLREGPIVKFSTFLFPDSRDPAQDGRVIDETPRPGSRGTTVAFIHPKGDLGTLVELVQE